MLSTAGWTAATAFITAVAARLAYPGFVERHAAARRPRGASGIVEGAEPISLPNDDAPGVLLLHGAGDTPQVLAALATVLHARGFAVRVPLLPGHAVGLHALRSVKAEEWRAAVHDEYSALRARQSRVGVVGLSLGGALAVELAATTPSVAALVLLAPYVFMPPALAAAARTSPAWGWLLPYVPSGGRRSIRDPRAAKEVLSYGVFTPAALRALCTTAVRAARALPRVQAPTRMIQSREDNRISVERGLRTYELLGASDKEMVWTEGAGHVISVDHGRERVFALTADWLTRYLSGSARRDSRPGP